MKNSIKVIAALLAIAVTVLTLTTATAVAFLALKSISILVAFLVVPVGAITTLISAIMIAAYADSKLD
jgi:uncharacterized membrane protein